VLKTLLQFSVDLKGLGLEGKVLGLALVLRVKSLTPSLRISEVHRKHAYLLQRLKPLL